MSCRCDDAAVYYKDNSMVIQLGTTTAPLTDDATGQVVTGATVTAQLEDVAGTPVSGEAWPIALPHIGGGVYQGIASYLVAVQVGVSYVVEIVATVSGVRGTWRIPVTAQERGA